MRVYALTQKKNAHFLIKFIRLEANENKIHVKSIKNIFMFLFTSLLSYRCSDISNRSTIKNCTSSIFYNQCTTQGETRVVHEYASVIY